MYTFRWENDCFVSHGTSRRIMFACSLVGNDFVRNSSGKPLRSYRFELHFLNDCVVPRTIDVYIWFRALFEILRYVHAQCALVSNNLALCWHPHHGATIRVSTNRRSFQQLRTWSLVPVQTTLAPSMFFYVLHDVQWTGLSIEYWSSI